MTIRHLFTLATLLCVGFSASPAAFSQTLDVNSNTSLSSGTYSQINVDPGTPEVTPVQLSFGGTTTTSNVTTFSNSVSQIVGGSVTTAITALDTSTVNVSGTASVARINAFDNSTVTMAGGQVTGFIYGYDNAAITATGGQSAGIEGRGNTVVTLDGATLTASSGVLDDSVFTMLSGNLNCITYVNQRGVLNILGGISTQPIFSFDASVLNMTAGVLGAVNLENNSQLNLRGGVITNNIMRVFQTGVVNIFGTGLGITSTTTGTEPTFGGYTDYTLTGTLLDGQSLTGMVLRDYDGGNQILNLSNPNSPNSTLNFNPMAVTVSEPATTSLFIAGMTSLSLLVNRRRFGKKSA